MCLGVPGQVIEIKNNIGVVKISDTLIKVGLDLVRPVNVGDYVLIHAGFAIQVIDQEEALLTWQLIKEMVDSA
ncbi:HypC/HybG/HupF family hydrogenase formation chaperone [Thermanaerosceptrum fracticalcis]|uniref:HypC/HybG/HupF family hydrogenase formation chaperone n=1 Tax=Thermanaerosceptrum fracticalcis TaxID=1712410 RepID=A0A7G6E3W8_THEFR|nr:HypC/HybG/HupF family hydrogenase formation chaperone [Thermanaerosceptrum fracticalcis]QNB46772.1 HypC/HybG/HupF family hydrogenase formation chaperone [Thermanaerosceptrum fracticalcis]